MHSKCNFLASSFFSSTQEYLPERSLDIVMQKAIHWLIKLKIAFDLAKGCFFPLGFSFICRHDVLGNN